MTALRTHVDRERILTAGFKAFLPKPFSPETLLKTILAVVNE
jgi:CheY-like chemotaxis protein